MEAIGLAGDASLIDVRPEFPNYTARGIDTSKRVPPALDNGLLMVVLGFSSAVLAIIVAIVVGAVVVIVPVVKVVGAAVVSNIAVVVVVVVLVYVGLVAVEVRIRCLCPWFSYGCGLCCTFCRHRRRRGFCVRACCACCGLLSLSLSSLCYERCRCRSRRCCVGYRGACWYSVLLFLDFFSSFSMD